MGVGSVLEIVMGALFTAAMGIFVFRVAKATDEEKRHCRLRRCDAVCAVFYVGVHGVRVLVPGKRGAPP